MKKLILTAILIVASLATAAAKDYQISTPKTPIILSAEEGETLYFRYYGS